MTAAETPHTRGFGSASLLRCERLPRSMRHCRQVSSVVINSALRHSIRQDICSCIALDRCTDSRFVRPRPTAIFALVHDTRRESCDYFTAEKDLVGEERLLLINLPEVRRKPYNLDCSSHSQQHGAPSHYTDRDSAIDLRLTHSHIHLFHQESASKE